MKAAAMVAAAGALALVGCSSDKTIDVNGEKALVQKGLSNAHATAKSIDCEGGVEAKVGNTAKCTAKLTNGQTATFVLKIDRVTDNGGHMTIVSAKTK